MKLNYEVSGKGKEVLLIHGNMASLNWWKELLDSPPKGVKLIAPNMPGFAGTNNLGKLVYSIEDYAKVIKQFILEMSLLDIRVVGHSLGGAVAMELMTTDPDLFHSSMLISSCPPEGIETSSTLYPLINSLKYNHKAVELLTREAMPHRQPPNFKQLVRDAQNMDSSSFVGNAHALDKWRLKGHNFYKNVYVVGGEDDKLITGEKLINTANKFRNNRLFQVTGSGHSPQIENPFEFRNIFDWFIKERKVW
jgi:pimeloyl-ACP methyl ester carboxylesterase